MKKPKTEVEPQICRQTALLKDGRPSKEAGIIEKNRLFAIVVMLTIATILWFMSPWKFGSYQTHQPTVAKEKFRIGDFSPDGKKIYLDYCDVSHACKIGWLDLATNNVTLFIPQDTHDVIASPSSSDDGRKLAVVVKEAANDYKSSQIAILDLRANSYRVVTHGYGLKEWPSFSHDGKKIIYARAGRLRTGGKTRFSEWDIYEIELASGTERQLTNFCFFLIDRPMYMRDNKRFVFSGDSPTCNFPSSNTSRTHGEYNLEDAENAQKGLALYKQMYQNNTVFLMSGNESTLKPLTSNGDYSIGATLSRDGKKIFFTSVTNKLDNLEGQRFNYDIFSFENGEIRRLTKLNALISGFVVSTTGDLIAYMSEGGKDREQELWLMNSTGNQRQKIVPKLDGASSTISISSIGEK